MDSNNAVLIIDKEEGLSSAKVVARVKALTRAKKAGHAGTLDPFASGVLVCCLNRATRLARYLLSHEKRYRAVLRLGVTTDTLDKTGKVVAEKPVPEITAGKLQSLLRQFTGKQMQTPPVYSALKHKGKPLYYWARKGTPAQKEARAVNIKALEAVAVEPPEVTFEVTCSAGTYIRQLGFDIADELGCGGHLTQLVRLASGPFERKHALTLEALETVIKEDRLGNHTIRPSDALDHMAEHVADERIRRKVAHGMRLTAQDGFDREQHGLLKIVDDHRTLLAIVEADKKEHSAAGHLKYRAVFI